MFDIWQRIAHDDVALANRIDAEFHQLFESLARMPGQGHVRRDLTSRPVRFISLYSFLVIYQANGETLRIMAILRGKRNVTKILKGRG